MADKVYDAIIIGGGHHGTTIAPYLAKAGLKVGVLSAWIIWAGERSRRISLLPDSRQFLRPFYALLRHPAYKEFDLRAEGWNTRFRTPMKPLS